MVIEEPTKRPQISTKQFGNCPIFCPRYFLVMRCNSALSLILLLKIPLNRGFIFCLAFSNPYIISTNFHDIIHIHSEKCIVPHVSHTAKCCVKICDMKNRYEKVESGLLVWHGDTSMQSIKCWKTESSSQETNESSVPYTT